jgi:hypothetical protein
MEKEIETFKEEIKELKQENERLKQQLSKYTNPERYKIYYEKNKETILKKKSEARSNRKNNIIDIRISTMTIKEISQLNNIRSNNDLANAYGLKIQTVSWEDTARTKGSCWGPNISDLTLMVENTPMNMIRKPNFSDITADIPHENFTVTVGNETNSGNLTRIPLKEYVQNITKYNEIEGYNKIELWDERDDSLLISAQCCLLPSNETTHETEFCPRMYNYQSAVLVIVSTSQGTSSCILSNRENLYFNRNGRKVSYLAKRLKQDRKERGVELEGKMTSEEEDRNAIIIYQIPLKSQQWGRSGSFGSCGGTGLSKISGTLTVSGGTAIYKNLTLCSSNDFGVSNNSVNTSFYCSNSGSSVPLSVDTGRIKKKSKNIGIDDAMLQVSDKDQGKFEKLDASKLIRDTRFPIRVTYQFYKVTDTTVLNESDFDYISNKINNIYNKAKDKGSLVLNTTSRPTEPIFTPLRISESQPALFKFTF